MLVVEEPWMVEVKVVSGADKPRKRFVVLSWAAAVVVDVAQEGQKPLVARWALAGALGEDRMQDQGLD